MIRALLFRFFSVERIQERQQVADGETRRNNRRFINMGASPITLTSAPKKMLPLLNLPSYHVLTPKPRQKKNWVSDFNPSEKYGNQVGNLSQFFRVKIKKSLKIETTTCRPFHPALSNEVGQVACRWQRSEQHHAFWHL